MGPAKVLQTGASIRVTVVNALGLHARSAARIAELAGRARATLWVCKGENRADASDILDVLALQCPQGTDLTLCAENDDDRGVLRDIAKLFADGFGEPSENE